MRASSATVAPMVTAQWIVYGRDNQVKHTETVELADEVAGFTYTHPDYRLEPGDWTTLVID